MRAGPPCITNSSHKTDRIINDGRAQDVVQPAVIVDAALVGTDEERKTSCFEKRNFHDSPQ